MKKSLLILLFSSSLFAQVSSQKPMLGAQINWVHPLAQGLVSCWLMNEGSGNKIFDYSENDYIGTFANGLSESNWQLSERGTGINFEGDSEELNPPSIPFRYFL